MTQEVITLVEQAKQGSESAFTKLYKLYKSNIWFTIYNIVKNTDIADDLTSVVFTKAYQKLDSYVQHISFEMWLKTIAINTAIDYIRSSKNEKQNHYIDSEDNYIQLDSNDLSPEEVIMKQETVEQLKVALHKLRSKYRNILELRYFKGLSYEELATELGVPIGTVKSDLNKAKKRLREFFDNINNN